MSRNRKSLKKKTGMFRSVHSALSSSFWCIMFISKRLNERAEQTYPAREVMAVCIVVLNLEEFESDEQSSRRRRILCKRRRGLTRDWAHVGVDESSVAAGRWNSAIATTFLNPLLSCLLFHSIERGRAKKNRVKLGLEPSFSCFLSQ